MSEFESKISRLGTLFGYVHHIRLPETHLADSVDWITECLARLFIHARLYQCQRFYGQAREHSGSKRCQFYYYLCFFFETGRVEHGPVPGRLRPLQDPQALQPEDGEEEGQEVEEEAVCLRQVKDAPSSLKGKKNQNYYVSFASCLRLSKV